LLKDGKARVAFHFYAQITVLISYKTLQVSKSYERWFDENFDKRKCEDGKKNFTTRNLQKLTMNKEKRTRSKFGKNFSIVTFYG